MKRITIKYELYYRTKTKDGTIESITPHRFKTLEEAQEKAKTLNMGLKYKGCDDTKCVIAKVTREYAEE